MSHAVNYPSLGLWPRRGSRQIQTIGDLETRARARKLEQVTFGDSAAPSLGSCRGHPSPCTFPGCPRLVRGRGSRCPEQSNEASQPNASQRGYASRRWRPIWELVIVRDGGACQVCGRLGRRVAHIRGLRLGGSNDPLRPQHAPKGSQTRRTAAYVTEAGDESE